MVTVPQGIQNPAYAPLSAHIPRSEFSIDTGTDCERNK